MNLEGYKKIYRQHGLLAMLHDFFIGMTEKVLRFRCLVVYVMDGPLAGVSIPDGYAIRKMSREDLRPYENKEPWDLPSFFVEDAIANGDECLGVFKGEELCGYAWYADEQYTSSMQLTTAFSRDYICTYKNMTLPEFRGIGLQKWVKSHAFDHYASQGKKGLIAAIESQNFASRKSMQGAGSRIVGYWPYVQQGEFYWGWGTSGCGRVGYSLRKVTG